MNSRTLGLQIFKSRNVFPHCNIDSDNSDKKPGTDSVSIAKLSVQNLRPLFRR